MKSVIFMFLISYACSPGHSSEAPQVQPVVADAMPETLTFEADIQPILSAHCTPCHFKDGKMYGRMPFDKSKTLVDFQDGILRRIKNEEEAAKIRVYLAGLK